MVCWCAWFGAGGQAAGRSWCVLGGPIAPKNYQKASAGSGALDASNIEGFKQAHTIPSSFYEEAGLEPDELEEELEYTLGRFLPGPVIKHMYVPVQCT